MYSKSANCSAHWETATKMGQRQDKSLRLSGSLKLENQIYVIWVEGQTVNEGNNFCKRAVDNSILLCHELYKLPF
jgi:hypothetical protein